MVNAGDLFAGAAVGGAFGPVFDVFREVVDKTFAFNPTLKSVKSTVDSLALLIPKIEYRNQILGGNRQGEVEELNEKMEEGKKLIEELLEVNEWNCLKAHYTDQLVDLDESLKRLLEILQVQGVIDVKEGLALTKDISTAAKEGLALTKVTSTDVKEGLALIKDTSKDAKEGLALTKVTSTDVKEGLALTTDTSNDVKKTFVLVEESRNHIIGFENTLKAGLKSQEAILQGLIRQLQCCGMANKVGSLNEAAALGATLEELHDAVCGEIFDEFSTFFGEIHRRTRGIYGLIQEKRAAEELKYFRVQLEEGVQLVRNCPKVLEWTDNLKSEYTNKFHHLNTILDTIYNRLNGIHPFKWNPMHEDLVHRSKKGTVSKASTIRLEKVMKKSESALGGFEDEDEGVDAKADDFINRFKQQLKLQRLDSLLRYKAVLSC